MQGRIREFPVDSYDRETGLNYRTTDKTAETIVSFISGLTE